MEKVNYLKFGRALLNAKKDETPKPVQEKDFKNDKPLKHDPQGLKKKIAADFLERNGADLKEKIKAYAERNPKADKMTALISNKTVSEVIMGIDKASR